MGSTTLGCRPLPRRPPNLRVATAWAQAAFTLHAAYRGVHQPDLVRGQGMAHVQAAQAGPHGGDDIRLDVRLVDAHLYFAAALARGLDSLLDQRPRLGLL